LPGISFSATGKIEMAKVQHKAGHGKTFKLDGAFIKREAKDALKGYFMPFSGIYAAATGKKVIIVRDRDGKWHGSKDDKAA
jgi:hypothetical protein